MSQSNKRGGFAALYDLAEKKKAERVVNPAPQTPVTGVTPVTPVTPVSKVKDKDEIAPKKDFTRVANSVVRDAIPAGLFTGKGKQLYDFLYSQTRGAVVPVRSARIPTERVMQGAGMTRHTYRAHLARLVHVGLVKVEEKAGEHGGNLFTVYLPEEVGVQRGDRGDRGHTGDTGQNLPVVQGSEVDRGDRGLSLSESTLSVGPKTLFKDNINTDDETYRDFLRILKEAVKEVTGRDSTPGEREKWKELAELITAELKIAAARTTVSSVPAFMTEHLRRRLWKLDKKQASAEVKPDAADERQPVSKEQARNCPDCGGTGFYYPKGFEGGVARCKHERLANEG